MVHHPGTRHIEGHQRGGPLVFGTLLLVLLAGCGGRSDKPAPDRGDVVARPVDVYRRVGLVAGPDEFPVVGSFGTLAGPADSTLVVFGLSLPNSALRFQREPTGFAGAYSVRLSFLRDSVEVRRVDRVERVRVASFDETGRTDESIVYQEVVALTPGQYVVQVEVRDALGTRGMKATDTLDVPDYRVATPRVAGPLLVYRAKGRESRGELPQLIGNPRRTVPYGGDSPRLYLEAYGAVEPLPVLVRVVNDEGTEVWSGNATVERGDSALRRATLDLQTDALPLGRLWVEARAVGDTAHVGRTPLFMTISDSWMVANFEEVLELLAYIANPGELDSLKAASTAERAELWDQFWDRRDPLPATPLNEFREQFFERVRVATYQFGESGTPGWKTDRGQVFIVLGPPDAQYERRLGQQALAAPPNALEWIYENAAGARLQLFFVDRNGFGRYELTPSSESAFRAVARRLRPRD